jgi:endonuclease G
MNRQQSQAVLMAVLVAALVLAYLVWTSDRGAPPPNDGPVAQAPEGAPPGPAAAAESNVHLMMGNPSGATDDPADADNYLMRKPYFALAYNNTNGTPNWVSWCLRESDLGSAPRGQFHPDPDLPPTFKHVTPRDYTGSGFDRGHMCPHGDRSSSHEAANATFAMTNIVPQAPALNQEAWADFEDYCRGLVRRRHETLYIVAGPQGKGGTGTNGPAETIARGKVTVPAKCWKVVLVVEGGEGGPADIARMGPDTRVIAVIMPNEESVGHGWAKYRTSVNEVEQLTGYTFFATVPAEVIGPLKAKVDDGRVPASRPRRSGG